MSGPRRARKTWTKTVQKGLIFLRKELPLEQDQVDGAYRDAAVGEVEDGFEEDVAAHEGDPVGPGPEREVEHVHHFALHEGRVVAPGGDQAGGGLGENQPVEQAVEDVAEGAGGDHGEAYEYAHGHGSTLLSPSFLVRRGPALQQLGDPPCQETEQDDPERGEGVLADHAAEGHAEGHSLVLDEQDLEPVGEDREGLPDGHVGLHQDFDDLVDDHEDGAEDQ